ncbi:MAG: aspartate/glutamate racemase family protein [Chitinophagaceae bacterium]|nr:aspartate/glutamate racemase family protein [Chitinophagaceae bacterium]
MKTLGLIGGISWVSTADYYKLINEGINEKLGGLNFAQCIIYSFNYADIKRNNDANDWDATFLLLSKACLRLENSGAEAILLCANTMHLIADRIGEGINLPLIHIASATATVIRKQQCRKVGLLGTKFTMERDFFTSKLAAQGIDTIIPPPGDRQFIHDTIFEELGKGIINPQTRLRYLAVIGSLVREGAEGIILGCTEIPLLIRQEDVEVPVFDTTRIHAAAAVDFALQ